jgi:hypothetical protein
MAEEFTANRKRAFPELVERTPSFISNNINQPLDDFVGIFRNRYNDSYASGLFELALPEQVGPVLGLGAPDMKNRSLQFYTNTLKDFSFALPHSAKWAVFVEPHNHSHLMDQIGNMSKYEPWGTKDDWNFGVKSERLLGSDAQETIGCIFALGVTQAGHSLGVSNMGGAGGVNNGFIKTPISQGRADNQTLELIVKETNSSYTDFVLRPWSILTSHLGFHARPTSQSIKCDITIFEMNDTLNNNQPVVRKVFKYYDCLPIDINTENLNYEADKVIQRQIQFTYNYYTVQGGEPNPVMDDTPEDSVSVEPNFTPVELPVIPQK